MLLCFAAFRIWSAKQAAHRSNNSSMRATTNDTKAQTNKVGIPCLKSIPRITSMHPFTWIFSLGKFQWNNNVRILICDNEYVNFFSFAEMHTKRKKQFLPDPCILRSNCLFVIVIFESFFATTYFSFCWSQTTWIWYCS